MVTPDTSLSTKAKKLCCKCADLKKKKSQGGFDFFFFLQCSSCAKWAERGVFSISATSWKWKCHIFWHFLSKFSPSLPIIHSAPWHWLEPGVWHDLEPCCIWCLCFYLLSLGQLSASIFLCFPRDSKKHRMQDKAVVAQVAFWGGVGYLYYYFLDGTSNPQEGGVFYKQPPGAAFELSLGLISPGQCQAPPKRFWLHHQWLSLQGLSGWDSKKSVLPP